MATIILTERQKRIALYLLDHPEFLTAHALSARFGVSEKSVRNDLSIVGAFFAESGVAVRREPSKGSLVAATATERQAISAALSQMASTALSGRQRLQIAGLTLLCRETCTYQEIADLCLVSKLTIVRDMRELESQLSQAGLLLQTRAGRGLSVSGSERQRRQYFIQLLSEGTQDLGEVLEKLRLQPFTAVASRFLQDLEAELGVVYLERFCLANAIGYCIARQTLGYLLEAQDGGQDPDEYVVEYSVILNVLCPYGVTQPEEVRFIAGLLMEAKVTTSEHSPDLSPHDPSAAAIANSILDEIRVMFQLPEQAEGKKACATLFNALYLHLKVALFRIRKNLPVKNELQEEVRLTIPLVYELTKQIVAKCEQRYGLHFAEDETAFIAMHIAAICEVNIGMRSDVDVLILCNFGLATSNVLKTRLLQMLPTCTIHGPLSTEEGLRHMDEHPPDLVISTSKLPGGRPSIVVNPLLFDEDTEKIHVAIAKKYYEKQCAFFIRAYAESVKLGETVLLKDIVPLEDIHIADRCADWEHAVYLTAEPLLKRGDLEKRYVEAIIRSVNQLGNYMILLPEIAFVHAGTNDGINRRCASILVLREPVLFGSRKQQDVRCIVLLGINDKTDDSLLKLIPIFENQVNRMALQSGELTVEMIHKMRS